MTGSLMYTNGIANHHSHTTLKDQKALVGAHPWIYAAQLPDYDITPAISKIFQDIKYAGYDGLELMHHPLRNHNTTLIIHEECDRYNLPVIGTSYGANMWDKTRHQEILEDAENIIINLASVGGRTFGTSVGKAPTKKTEEQLDDQAELLKKLIEICHTNGIVLNLHNHTYEIEDDMHDLKGTLQRIPDAKLGPDLNWLDRGGVDPIDFLKKYGHQVVFLHLRDQFNNGKWSESLGEGDVDFKVIGKMLKRMKFNGDIVIELAHEQDFVPTRPIRESLKLSREYIKTTMGY
jgi:sugar phosphate isomerase/epimerase